MTRLAGRDPSQHAPHSGDLVHSRDVGLGMCGEQRTIEQAAGQPELSGTEFFRRLETERREDPN